MEMVDRRLVAVAGISAAVVALSILTAVVGGEASSAWVWFLLFPVGMLGAGVVSVVSLALLAGRRLRA